MSGFRQFYGPGLNDQGENCIGEKRLGCGGETPRVEMTGGNVLLPFQQAAVLYFLNVVYE